jgi:serine/threonine protein kinase
LLTHYINKIAILSIEKLHILHTLGYLHNDIKPDNVLVNITDICKMSHLDDLTLIDFGLATTYLNEKGEHVE